MSDINYKEWVKTSDALPSRSLLESELGKGVVDSDYADCFIFVRGEIKERPFNFDHNCWDDLSYDDFEYEATEPTHWMLAYPHPRKPED